MNLLKADPLEVAEIRRVGFLGWVNALAMKSSSGVGQTTTVGSTMASL